MHTHSIEERQHDHVFLGEAHAANERRTWAVVALTLAMMVAEIIGGALTGSMALTADGWHMSTHAAALGIAAFGYRIAGHYAHDPRFSFGTGKVGELAAYTSALLLTLVAIAIAWESIARLLTPSSIYFGEAVAIAVLGLAVNLFSAWLLGGDDRHHHDHHHHHDHDHSHTHDHHARDHNIRAAYIHVLADAMTSLLAILALTVGWLGGWAWLDAAVGLFGACVIASWAVGLLRSSSLVLLDATPNEELTRVITQRLELGTDRVSDLHVWRLGPGHAGVIVSIITDDPQPPSVYKGRLEGIPGLSHVTVEVHPCRHAATGSGCC